ncbi:transglycosylase-like protein with SLT domain [Rhodovulum imhoffii]|uniref:Transglycosylase-like protein with SLT domain n=1 Tax=Rhodovulum imhoffii TaxID=365340 RepID=A0A2T5BRE6_9RHOB|nr:transglycosylase SLT domain-containing protein [Rhodovulum imhoffii]MBK5934482.1 lytic transglycosylase [Rhodovulum imhoffii]PTN01832.1 transglycosylase-like protein with SLT domain [Rhodovulum imhoffii]
MLRALVCCLLLGACSAEPGLSTRSDPIRPQMRWDHRAEAEDWTNATLAALEGHGAVLTDVVPADIATYCPAYPEAGPAQRRAFWAGLFSALAKHESTWNPAAVGGGGRWFGLVQIAPATARGYGCAAKSGMALKDGVLNLSCAVRIAAHTVPRDGVVSRGMRGIAADWGPFHSAVKRADIAGWTASQSYCRQ